MKLKAKQRKAILKFLDRNKHFFGLSEWKINVDEEIKIESTSIAEVVDDIYEKELNVTICDEYMNSSPSKRENTLIHELIHARVSIFNTRWKMAYNELKKAQDAIREEEEEFFVNDLTKGFLKYDELKTDKNNI